MKWTDERLAAEQRRLDARKEQAQREKEVYDQRLEIHKIRNQMRRWKPPTTTKILMAYIFGNCTIVEIYSMVAMWHLEDLSALYALIAAVVTEGFSLAVYCAKSYNETKQEELIKLERDKLEMTDTEPTREDAMG